MMVYALQYFRVGCKKIFKSVRFTVLYSCAVYEGARGQEGKGARGGLQGLIHEVWTVDVKARGKGMGVWFQKDEWLGVTVFWPPGGRVRGGASGRRAQWPDLSCAAGRRNPSGHKNFSW